MRAPSTMERISSSSSAKYFDYHKNSIRNLAMASLLFALLLYISSIGSPTISRSAFQFPPLSIQNAVVVPKDELESALIAASMPNRTLIIAVVNKAYVEGANTPMLDLFLESFWLGENTRWLINHLLLVTVDEVAFQRCDFLRLHCYRLVTQGVDFGAEKLYMSRDFVNMMWRRTQLLGDVLIRGYSFIFTDIDVMWLRNPFTRLAPNGTVDIQISCDHFNGNQWSQLNLINTGFYFVRSNNKTVSLFDTWHSMRNNSNCLGMKEQDVLKYMMQVGILSQLGVKVRFLDTVYFSGFCEDSRRFGMVTTVHANCCRTIGAKVADLTAVLGDWKMLKALIRDWRKKRASKNRTVLGWSRHVACADSWIGFNFSSNRVIS